MRLLADAVHTGQALEMGIAGQQSDSPPNGCGVDYRVDGRQLLGDTQFGCKDCDVCVQGFDQARLRKGDDFIGLVLASLTLQPL
jgi:hypothetical protein